MATANPVVEEPVGEEEAETEVISYPLRVDYCGLCSMPPEVIIRLAACHE